MSKSPLTPEDYAQLRASADRSLLDMVDSCGGVEELSKLIDTVCVAAQKDELDEVGRRFLAACGFTLFTPALLADWRRSQRSRGTVGERKNQ